MKIILMEEIKEYHNFWISKWSPISQICLKMLDMKDQ